MRALLTSPRRLKVHVSDNDGRRDVHWMLTDPPWWWVVLTTAHRIGMTAVVFSEGNQLRDPGVGRRPQATGSSIPPGT